MANDKTKILRDAEKYVVQGKLAQAIAEYLKLIKLDPNDVLTANTIGDLYLRQGKIDDARRYFSQVADSYARNNFLLKAIAVYKKILAADPDNIEINQTLAALYAKQGLNVDARSQYQKIAELSAREGKTKETLEAYEKVVELDPANAAVHLKLGDINLSEGQKERAHAYYAAAARAQVKGGDVAAAVQTYRKAMQVNPVNVETMRGFLDASIEVHNVGPAVEQLKKSLVMVPEDRNLRQMLGEGYLAARDLENAQKVFQELMTIDEGYCEHFFPLSKAFLEAGDHDQAAETLRGVLPVMIARRETERAADGLREILKSNPDHLLSLTLLLEIYSAVSDEPRQLEALERIAGFYLSRQSPREAIDYIERILQLQPNNAKYQRMHRDAFTDAFPGAPYTPPKPPERRPVTEQFDLSAFAPADQPISLGNVAAAAPSSSNLVEVDMLLGYGMKDRAVELLESMRGPDPENAEIRTRLVALYRELGEQSKAAEECVALAGIFRRSNNDDLAAKYTAEARSLGASVPKEPESARASARSAQPAHPTDAAIGGVVDLSGDLSEIFFKNEGETLASEGEDVGSSADEIIQEVSPKAPKRITADMVQEQLQEADFYIRLGFFDEARAKLNDIAKEFPNHPELPLRFRKLKDAPQSGTAPSIALGPGERDPKAPVETTPPDGGDIFEELKIDRAVDHFVESYASEQRAAAREKDVAAREESVSAREDAMTAREEAMNVAPHQDSATAPSEDAGQPPASIGGARGGDGAGVNAMFADLIEEVNSLTDQQIAQEDFETHFNLGIAYREMELVDEAIREFQTAAQTLARRNSPRELIQCCGMLSTCFLKKGMPRSAIRWCQTGLGVPEISRHEAMALRYDMGVAHALTGEGDRALECFHFVFDIDPTYRDVAARIDELRGRS